jgi:hypothetical protein
VNLLNKPYKYTESNTNQGYLFVDSKEFTAADKARDSFINRNDIDGKNLRYPADLEEQSPHYIIFYPLVRSESRIGKSLTARNGGKPPVVDQSQQNRVNPDKGGVAATAAGAGAGAALGIADALAKTGGKNAGGVTLAGTLGSITGGIFAGGLGGAVSSQIAGEQEVLEGAGGIALQIGERLSTSYRANWQADELGTLVGSIAAGNQSLLGALNPLNGENIKLAARSGGLLAKALGADALENVIAATSKTVKNPYKEQFFKSMDNRKFSFDYVFAPKTQQEAETVFGRSGIIQKFAYHMHPELSKSGYFFNYPSEFSIVYYFNGAENKYVRKVSSCVLESMSVDYGAEGFTTFANGMPTQATVRLNFLELELLTTQRVYQGF